jgi:hypothetical protein
MCLQSVTDAAGPSGRRQDDDHGGPQQGGEVYGRHAHAQGHTKRHGTSTSTASRAASRAAAFSTVAESPIHKAHRRGLVVRTERLREASQGEPHRLRCSRTQRSRGRSPRATGRRLFTRFGGRASHAGRGLCHGSNPFPLLLLYSNPTFLSCTRVPSLLQISRAVLGDDQSSWWKTAAATKHVREISAHSAHEVAKFPVIRRSNGRTQTITPALQASARAAGSRSHEQRRLENAAGKTRALTQIQTLLKCPFCMPSCNRKSMACDRCRAELGLPARIYKRRPKTELLLGSGSSSNA